MTKEKEPVKISDEMAGCISDEIYDLFRDHEIFTNTEIFAKINNWVLKKYQLNESEKGKTN